MHEPAKENRARAEHPSLPAMVSFLVRSKGLQAKHLLMHGFAWQSSLEPGDLSDFPFIIAESLSLLDLGTDPRERPLLWGKIQNLRIACRRINRSVLPAGAAFSFWRQVGPPWRWRGFAVGREIRQGCVIPTVGGGLCQLSGSLLEVALALDFELLERHCHTAWPIDAAYHAQRDATVFWNYVDLRFRSPIPVMLESYLTEDALIVRIRAKQQRIASSVISAQPPEVAANGGGAESCYTCNQTGCVRHQNSGRQATHAKIAYLLDEYQPEFDAYIREHVGEDDHLQIPFMHSRPGGDWSTRGFASVQSSFFFRWRRSWKLRSAVWRRITVAKVHFEMAKILADLYERHLSYDVEHLCVSQTLLPHLWKSGALGGRSFDVLMARPPVAVIEQQLNRAAGIYPQSRTLTEFRAPRWFAQAEADALQAARKVITPHPQIAALFQNAIRLPWKVPATSGGTADGMRDAVVFLGPTLARKGAYAVREAVKKMGCTLTVVGADLEEPGFWKGLPVRRENLQQLQWHNVQAVVQPALFEFWPRQLLRAHAAGCRVITSPFCGFEQNVAQGIHHVPFGDADALVTSLEAALAQQRRIRCAL